MTVRELIRLLITQEPDCMEYELFAESPDRTEDYFFDSLKVNDTQKQILIKTAQ